MKTHKFNMWLKRSRTFVLWCIGLFFLLGGAITINESLWGGLFILIGSILIFPHTWRILTKFSGKEVLKRYRVITATLLIFAGIMIAPAPQTDEQTSNEKVVEDTTVLSVESEPEPISTKIIPKLVNITRSEDRTIKVTGVSDQSSEVYISTTSSGRVNAFTDSKGNFTAILPANTSPYGILELQHKTGMLLTSKYHTNHVGYYSLFSGSGISDKKLDPIITEVSGSEEKTIVGYYLPNTKVGLVYNKKTLGQAKTNSDGWFKLRSIRVDENYAKMSTIEVISTGWFSSRDETIGSALYLDRKANRVTSKLPVYEKEESKISSIDFSTKTVKSNSINKGKSEVKQGGLYGQKKVLYLVKYEGDKEISRKIVSTEVTRKPVDKIIVVGTYVKPKPVVAPRPAPTPAYTPPPATTTPSAYYQNCTAARAAGVTPIYQGQPGYGIHLDRDRDGIACE